MQLSTRELHEFSHYYTHLVPSVTVCQRNPFFCKLWNECYHLEAADEVADQRQPFPGKHFRWRANLHRESECNRLGSNGTAQSSASHIDNLRFVITSVCVYIFMQKYDAYLGGKSLFIDCFHNFLV